MYISLITLFRSQEILYLVHTNLCGPMLVQTNGGVKYFVVFINNYSWYIMIYLLHNKSNVFDTFQVYKVMVETKINKKLETIWFDKYGGEFKSNEFSNFCEVHGISKQLTNPYAPIA
jgi:hypothetical protein